MLLYTLGSWYLLTIGFLCYAAVLPVWRELPILTKVWLTPLVMFYLVDIAARLTAGTLLFWGLPTTDTLTVTALCNAHCNDPSAYKRWLARNICGVLNMIQPHHCEAYK